MMISNPQEKLAYIYITGTFIDKVYWIDMWNALSFIHVADAFIKSKTGIELAI